MEPIKSFTDEQYDQALESWSWIDFTGKIPRFTSLFGDVFLESADGWWFLDVIEGDLAHLWQTRDELQQALNTSGGQDRYLLLRLAEQAEARGVKLAEHEVYALTPPPVLGGPLDPANVNAADFVVAVNLAGQIHDQVRALPDGEAITGSTLT